MKTITTLTGENSPKLLKIAEHLKTFIEGITDIEADQKNLLKIAMKTLREFPLSKANPDCKICFGRGFEGYDKYNKRFISCRKCFKPT